MSYGEAPDMNGHDNSEWDRDSLLNQIRRLKETVENRDYELRRLRTVIDEYKTGIQMVCRVEEIIDERHAIVRNGSENFARVVISSDVTGLKVGDRAVLSPPRGVIIDKLGAPKENKLIHYKLDTMPNVTYEDVIGLKTELESLRRAIEWIIDPAIEEHRTRLVKDTRLVDDIGSVLLFGPPGVGKTFMAKAVAGSLGKIGKPTTFIKMESYELISRWLGESAENVRHLFQMARESAPAILFMDEIDAITRQRTEATTDAGRDVQGMLNQLLSEMGEGFKSNKGVATVLATNFPQVLDEALMSRVKKVIYVPPPRTPEDVYLILNHYLSKAVVDPKIFKNVLKATAFEKLWELLKSRTFTYEAAIKEKNISIRDTYMTTPRELKNVVEEAVTEAAFEGKPYVTLDMLETQFKKLQRNQVPTGVNYQ